MIIFIPLELEVNKHMEKTNVTVTDLNGIDMFLEYDWLVKHNSEVNQNKGMIQFTRYLKECKTQHQDIVFISRTRKIKPIKNRQRTLENRHRTRFNQSRKYIGVFKHLFNKKKFKKRELDYKINLLEDVLKI